MWLEMNSMIPSMDHLFQPKLLTMISSYEVEKFEHVQCENSGTLSLNLGGENEIWKLAKSTQNDTCLWTNALTYNKKLQHCFLIFV
jgi:hypothetical protein